MNITNHLKIKSTLFVLISLNLFSCTDSNRNKWVGNKIVTCTDDNCTTVGGYNLNSIFGGALPLGAFSTNRGQSFTASSAFTLPSYILPELSTQLIGVHCNDMHCTGVGIYNLNVITSITTPPPGSGQAFTATSEDGGKTFFTNNIQPLLPIDADTTKLAELAGITCHDKICVGVGTYNLNIFAGPIGGLPLSVVSHDNGTTFSMATRPSLPNDADTVMTNAALVGVSCPSSERCVGVGYYNFNYMVSPISVLPYSVISDDGGDNFTEVSTIILPSDAVSTSTQFSKLRAITCQNLQCVAAGFYQSSGNAALTPMPLITLSQDGGKTFTKSYQPILPSDADFSKPAEITGINCRGKRCIAIGHYNTILNMGNPVSGSPFVMISHNAGKTFSRAYQPTLPIDTDPSKAVMLTGIDCTKQSCVIVGGYNLSYFQTNVNGGIPLILFSYNHGDTFIPAPGFALPTGADTSKGAIFGLGNQF